MTPGYYLNLPEAEYHAVPALSKSGIKKLLGSPLDFWEATYGEKKEESRHSLLGKARHKMILEGPEAFERTFCRACDPADYPEALTTADDLKGWLKDRKQTFSGLTKEKLIAKIRAVALEQKENPPRIFELIKSEHGRENRSRSYLPAPLWESIEKTRALYGRIREMLGAGIPEVSLFWRDETGIDFKARLDWLGIAREGYLRVADLKDYAKTTTKIRTDAEAVAQKFATDRHDLDGFVYLRALKQTPRVVHGGGPDALAEIFDALDAKAFPRFLAHPEFQLLYCRKDSLYPVFTRRTVEYRREGEGLTNIAAVADVSFRRATETYLDCMARFGPDRPWHDLEASRCQPIDEADLPMSYISIL